MSNFTPIDHDSKIPTQTHILHEKNSLDNLRQKTHIENLPVSEILRKNSLSEKKPIKFSAEHAEDILEEKLSATAAKIDAYMPPILGMKIRLPENLPVNELHGNELDLDLDTDELLDNPIEESLISSYIKEDVISKEPLPKDAVKKFLDSSPKISLEDISGIRGVVFTKVLPLEIALEMVRYDLFVNPDLNVWDRENNDFPKVINGKFLRFEHKIWVKASDYEALLKDIKDNHKNYELTKPLEIYLIHDSDWEAFTIDVLPLINQIPLEDQLEEKKEKKNEFEKTKLASENKSGSMKELFDRRAELDKEIIAQSKKRSLEAKLEEKAYQVGRNKLRASIEKEEKIQAKKHKVKTKEEEMFRLRKDDKKRLW